MSSGGCTYFAIDFVWLCYLLVFCCLVEFWTRSASLICGDLDCWEQCISSRGQTAAGVSVLPGSLPRRSNCILQFCIFVGA